MSVVEVHILSRMQIEAHEDSKAALVTRLERLGCPVERANALPVDVLWTVDGACAMFDLKKPQDLIASVEDGRLGRQVDAMLERKCFFWGFVIEGAASHDGITVGYGTHAWEVERYDNLLVSLQCEGATIVHSESAGRTASRLFGLYRWSGKSNRGSWRRVVRPAPAMGRMYGDKAYRQHVESLMSWPSMGETRANALLDKYTYREVLTGGVELWSSVAGVGKGLAAKWEEFLGADYRTGV